MAVPEKAKKQAAIRYQKTDVASIIIPVAKDHMNQ